MELTIKDIARMIDFSAVGGGVGEAEVEELARHALEYRFIGVHVLPCYVKKLNELLGGAEDILIGSGIGFPSGAHTTEIKAREAQIALADGCREVDMVVNVGALRSGDYKYVENDIKAVVNAADGLTTKVILEVYHLTEDQIKKGCELCINAGAHYVKTATGWAPTGATIENMKLIKKTVGDAIKIKAAGGIRDLATLVEMYKIGATRFGISQDSTLKILEECRSQPGGAVSL